MCSSDLGSLSRSLGSRLARLLDKEPPLSNDKIADELFLGTLSRYPADEERKIALEMLGRYRSKGAEDVLWVLLTKVEFLFY